MVYLLLFWLNDSCHVEKVCDSFGSKAWKQSLSDTNFYV